MRIWENGGKQAGFGFAGIAGAGKEKRTGHSGSIYAGALREEQPDALEKRRLEIRRKAVRILQDKFEADGKLDQQLEDSRSKVANAQGRLDEINQYCKEAPELAEQYREFYAEEIRELEKTVIEETCNIRSMKQGRLEEEYTMADAAQQEQKTLQAGSEELVGMMVQDAVQHVDELYQENQEKAEQAQEKKEELEERLQAVREKKEALQQQLSASAQEQIKESGNQEQSLEAVNEGIGKNEETERELQKLQRENELLEEELKGLLVDALL